jgi:diacylglycerol kinase (ATP)
VNVCIVRNPSSGSAEAFAPLLEAIAVNPELTLLEGEGPEEIKRAVRQAARDGYDVVAAAGGDGTVHAVANALLAEGTSADDRPALAILPFGTGNDLARTLAVPFDPKAALALIASGARRHLEVIALRAPSDAPCYAVNVVSGGFAADMRERLHDGLKKRWGPLAYLIAGLETLPSATVYRLRLRRDAGPEESLAVHSLVVASGRTAGGGRPAAPMANPEDGWLDVVVVREASVAELAALAARAALGDYLQSDLVDAWRVRRLHVESEPPMKFAVDGEMKAETPVTFEAVPDALRVVVGEGYTPEPGATPEAA